MQGIPSGFALTAIANFLAGKGLSSQSVGSFVAIVGLPWVFQFFWGPVIDRYQYSVIGHRKQWIVLTQLLACFASLGMILISDPIKQLNLLTAAFFIHSIFASIQDASVDAMAISVVPENERGRVNACMRGGYLLGISVGSAGLSIILHRLGFHTAVLIQSAVLLALTLLTYLIKLDRKDSYLPQLKFIPNENSRKSLKENPPLKWLFLQLYRGIFQKHSLSVFGIIALVYACNSVFIRSYSYHLIHSMKWQYNDVSILQGGWGTLVTILVTISGGAIADRIGPHSVQKRIMVAIGLFLIFFNLFSNFWFLRLYSSSGLILWNFADPLFSVAAMPILMSLCKDKVEGSQFTAYMAMVNLCDVAGAYLSGWLMSIVKAPVIGLICGLIVLLALLFIPRQLTGEKAPV